MSPYKVNGEPYKVNGEYFSALHSSLCHTYLQHLQTPVVGESLGQVRRALPVHPVAGQVQFGQRPVDLKPMTLPDDEEGKALKPHLKYMTLPDDEEGKALKPHLKYMTLPHDEEGKALKPHLKYMTLPHDEEGKALKPHLKYMTLPDDEEGKGSKATPEVHDTP